MRAVNLLPRDTRSSRRGPSVDPLLGAGAALALVVCCALGAGWLTAHSRAAAEASKLADAQAVLASVGAAPAKPAEKPSKPILPVPAVTAEQQPRLDAVAGVLASRTAWDRVLREFAQIVPSDVTVSGVTMDAPDPTAATPGDFELNGTTYSHDGVARLLSRLMLVPDLTDVSLSKSTADPALGVVSFTIDAQVKGTGA
ncbi:MAG TPA: PilN domain-containing protein [Gaiellaceae bacterium]|nr:PilN domain-containing protein [Gaiellaceae bacterium]